MSSVSKDRSSSALRPASKPAFEVYSIATCDTLSSTLLESMVRSSCSLRIDPVADLAQGSTSALRKLSFAYSDSAHLAMSSSSSAAACLPRPLAKLFEPSTSGPAAALPTYITPTRAMQTKTMPASKSLPPSTMPSNTARTPSFAPSTLEIFGRTSKSTLRRCISLLRLRQSWARRSGRTTISRI